MKYLIQQLKPHWKFVVLILLAHLVQAYTTLLLPGYTSNLVDVGIQNSGFEYAVPVELTEGTYSQMSSLMYEDEVEELADRYQMNSQGHYALNTELVAEDEDYEALETFLSVPLAMLQLRSALSEEEQAQFAQIMEQSTTQAEIHEIRQAIEPEVAKLGTATIRSAAIQQVIREYEATGNDIDSHQMAYLFKEGMMMLAIAIATFASAGVAFYLASIVGAEVGFDLRGKIFGKVLSFSQTELSEFSTASLITRSTNDIQQLQLVVTLLLRIIIFSPILAVGGIINILLTQFEMSWILALAVGLIAVTVGILFSLVMPKFRILQKQVDRINLYAREILTGLQVIRAFGRQDHEAERFDSANKDLQSTFMFAGRSMSLMMPIMMLIANVISVLIVWVGGHRIASGEMQVGEMMAFITYTMQVIFSFLMFSLMSMQIPRALVSAERVQEVLNTPLSIQDPETPVVLEDVEGLVEFKDVTFSFEDSEEETLQHISFTARPGETTAIIGSTGSGKSTILSLLMRFYDATKGQITIDGVDVRDMAQHQLRELVGFVPQKGILFSGTIESNIGYGVDKLPTEMMEQAAEVAHAQEFIDEKSDKYQAYISQGGGNVSGGQKQRLSIARAIAKQPKIFVFDDSFSALDYRTDASLRQALKDKITDATMIIVAQRISTILDAEQIIVLDEGVVDGIGTHNELMAKSAVYREIATSQLSQAELDEQEAKGDERAELRQNKQPGLEGS